MEEELSREGLQSLRGSDTSAELLEPVEPIFQLSLTSADTASSPTQELIIGSPYFLTARWTSPPSAEHTIGSSELNDTDPRFSTQGLSLSASSNSFAVHTCFAQAIDGDERVEVSLIDGGYNCRNGEELSAHL